MRRLLNLRVLSAATALAVAALATAAGGAARDGPGRITGSVRVPSVGDVAATGDTLYAVARSARRGRLVVVDARSLAVRRRVLVGSYPDSIDASGRRAWVVNTIGDGKTKAVLANTVVEYDDRGREVSSARVAGAYRVAADNAQAWVLSATQRALFRVRSGRATRVARFAGMPEHVDAAGGRVWVTVGVEAGGGTARTELAVFDAASGARVRTIVPPRGASRVVATPRGGWSVDSDGLTRYDGSGAPVAELAALRGSVGAAADGEGVWIWGSSRSLTRVSAAGGVLGRVGLLGVPLDASAARGSVYAALAGGTVVRVRAS